MWVTWSNRQIHKRKKILNFLELLEQVEENETCFAHPPPPPSAGITDWLKERMKVIIKNGNNTLPINFQGCGSGEKECPLSPMTLSALGEVVRANEVASVMVRLAGMLDDSVKAASKCLARLDDADKAYEKTKSWVFEEPIDIPYQELVHKLSILIKYASMTFKSRRSSDPIPQEFDELMTLSRMEKYIFLHLSSSLKERYLHYNEKESKPSDRFSLRFSIKYLMELFPEIWPKMDYEFYACFFSNGNNIVNLRDFVKNVDIIVKNLIIQVQEYWRHGTYFGGKFSLENSAVLSTRIREEIKNLPLNAPDSKAQQIFREV
jgi:hypothetical protein